MRAIVTGCAGFIGSHLGDALLWEPEVSFEDRLRATVESYSANRDWWEQLKEGAPVLETSWS